MTIFFLVSLILPAKMKLHMYLSPSLAFPTFIPPTVQAGLKVPQVQEPLLPLMLLSMLLDL